MKTRPEKIHALTSMRFFAAFYVVLYHTLGQAFGREIAGTWIERVNALGYIAVSFFFLLSGYILAIVYLHEGATVRKRSFYAARFARIYPLFLVTLFADIPYAIAQRASEYGMHKALSKTAVTLGAHLLMLQAWIPGIHGIDQPNWSLSVETLFYLIFPVVGVVLWRLRGAALWLSAAGIWLVSQAAVWLITPHLAITTAKFHPLFHVGTFALGILLARVQTLRSRNLLQRRSIPPAATAATLVALLLIFIAAVRWQDQVPLPALNAGLLSPAFAALIWISANNDGALSRWLSAPWLVLLGEASFGLYLIHVPVNHLFEWLHWEHSQPLYPLYLALCIGLSIFSFYCIENPSRKWLLKRLQTRPKETMEAASDAQ